MNVRRRSLLTVSAALAAFAAMRDRAEAATPFTTFAFNATGGTAARTMPDRLADIKNVLDFGADPTGSADSATAIQNAVNWTNAANRGTIFFPTGSYKIGSAITFNASGVSIHFLGEGAGTNLFGSGWGATNGFILDRSLVSPSNTGQVIIEKLNIAPSSTGANSGAIRVGSCNSVAVRDCHLGGNICLTTEDSAGNSSTGILIENVIFPGGNFGLIMGGSGFVTGCDWTSCNIGACMYGSGWVMSGNRIERCNTAYQIGLDSAVTDQNASAFVISGGTTEGNWTSFDFRGTCSGFYVGSVGSLAHNSASENSGIGALTVTSYTYNSGTGLVTLTMAATIPEVLVPGINLTITGLNIAGLNVTALCASASGTTVTYTGPTGQAGSPSGGGGVWLGGQYGFRVRANKASNGVFSGISAIGDSFDAAALAVGTATSRANLLFLGSTFSANGGTGVDVSAPSNAYTAQFQQCTFASFVPVWTYSQLPTGGNVLEGDEFSISDALAGNCSDSACGWGANVTGGTGALHRWVRWNGLNYTVVAK